MVNVSYVITVLQLCTLTIIISLTLVYSIPIILIRRFRHRTHIFTLDVCMAILFCSIYWIVYYIMTYIHGQQFYSARLCSLMSYIQTMCTLQVPLAFTMFSIYRLCCIVYHNKPYFKSKQWVLMCITCQWMVGLVIPLPIFIMNPAVCYTPVWMCYYILAIIIVIPMSVCVVIDIMIFKHVQASSRRTQPIGQLTAENNDQSTRLSRRDDQPTRLSRRDLHLLRHMIIMFFVFIVGWAPIYITGAIINYVLVSTLTLRILSLLTQISFLCDMIDLFLYSHELRQYLQRTLLPCYYN